MRKIALALAATMAMSSAAHAEYYDWQHRGPRPGYYPHHEYRGGGNWVAPLIGGMIVGGALMEMSQPREVVVVPQQPVCQKVFVGNVVVDGQMVQAYKTVCN
jgi:hypothetical protein